MAYFNNFEQVLKMLLKKLEKFTGNKRIKANIFRVQSNNSKCVDTFALD